MAHNECHEAVHIYVRARLLLAFQAFRETLQMNASDEYIAEQDFVWTSLSPGNPTSKLYWRLQH